MFIRVHSIIGAVHATHGPSSQNMLPEPTAKEVTFYARRLTGPGADYALLSDWYPAPLPYAGLNFSCAGMALFYVKAALYDMPVLQRRVLEINAVMDRFYSQFLRHGERPAFWDRWDEQVALVLECDAAQEMQQQVDEQQWLSTMHTTLTMLLNIKVRRHAAIAMLLTSTGAAPLREVGLTTGQLLARHALSPLGCAQCAQWTAEILAAIREQLPRAQ